MNRKVLWVVPLVLMLHTAYVALAAFGDSSTDSSSYQAPTSTTSTTTSTSVAPTTTSTSTTAHPSHSPPPPTTTYPPLVEEKWSNMSLKFFIIFVSAAGGVGVVAFIIITAVCCREYKLLETDSDSDSESVYSESDSAHSSSSSDERDYPSDTVSQTERSWDAESNIGTPQYDEASLSPKPPRHRQQHRLGRSRPQSRNVSTPSSEEEAVGTEEFWNNSF